MERGGVPRAGVRGGALSRSDLTASSSSKNTELRPTIRHTWRRDLKPYFSSDRHRREKKSAWPRDKWLWSTTSSRDQGLRMSRSVVFTPRHCTGGFLGIDGIKRMVKTLHGSMAWRRRRRRSGGRGRGSARGCGPRPPRGSSARRPTRMKTRRIWRLRR